MYKHVQESMVEYGATKFFNKLYENKDSKDKDQKGKEIEAVLKKVMDNWAQFKKASGDNLTAWKSMFQIQDKCKQQIGSYNPTCCYKLFADIKKVPKKKDVLVVRPSNYVVASALVDNKPALVVLNKNPEESVKDKEDEVVFVAKSPKAAAAFEKICKQMIIDGKAAKQNYKDTVERKQKEEEAAIKKQKLDGFLKESWDSKGKTFNPAGHRMYYGGRKKGSHGFNIKQLSVEEFDDIVDKLIANGDKSIAIKEIKELFDANPYMNHELGEIPGHDKYMEPFNKLMDWLGELGYDPDEDTIHTY